MFVTLFKCWRASSPPYNSAIIIYNRCMLRASKCLTFFFFKLSPQVFLYLFSPKNDSVLTWNGRFIRSNGNRERSILKVKCNAPPRSFSAQYSMVSKLVGQSSFRSLQRHARLIQATNREIALLIVNVKICVAYWLYIVSVKL